MQALMEWISVKDGLPKTDCLCYVKNDKGWMFGEKAFFHHTYNAFVHFDPHSRSNLTLEATHYVVLPC